MKTFLSGLALMILAIVWYLFPPNHVTGLTWFLYISVYAGGYMLLCDALIQWRTGKAFLSYSRRGVLLHIFMLGIVGGVIFEFFGNWIFKTWYYPPLNTLGYLLSLLFWGWFFIIMLESYRLAVVLLAHSKRSTSKLKFHRYYRYLFPIIGLLGMVILVVITTYALATYHVPVNPLDILNGPWDVENNLTVLLLVPISMGMIFEWLQYKRSEKTLLMCVIDRDFIPLVSITSACFVTALSLELYNLPLGLWRYTNLPFQTIKFMSIPVSVLLFWPSLYILFLAFYHIIYKHETRHIWD